MNNYNEVLKTAKYLRDEYKELTIHQSLDIAAKIQQCDVFRDGLMVNGSNPVALEAIAMALGHAPLEEGRITVSESLEGIRSAMDERK